MSKVSSSEKINGSSNNSKSDEEEEEEEKGEDDFYYYYDENDFKILSYLSSLSGGFKDSKTLIKRFKGLKLYDNHHQKESEIDQNKPKNHQPHSSFDDDDDDDDESKFYEPSENLKSIFNRSDCNRRNLWSFVLGIQPKVNSIGSGKEKYSSSDFKNLPVHRDENQVELDVNRSFVYYPKNISDSQKLRLRKLLNRTIVKLLRKFPELCYFQGFHDIVSIFLLNFIDFDLIGSSSEEKERVVEDDLREETDPLKDDDQIDEDQIEYLDRAIQRFTLHRIRDSLYTNLSPIMGYLQFTQAILSLERPDFASLVAQTSSLPIFSLSWILTLTSHDLTSFEAVSRLFDFLICHEPIMICYLACAICLSKEAEIQDLVSEAERSNEPIDFDMVHFLMSKLPVLVLEEEEGDGEVDDDFKNDGDSIKGSGDNDLKIENPVKEEEGSEWRSRSNQGSDHEDVREDENLDISASSQGKVSSEDSSEKRSHPPLPKVKDSVSIESIISSTMRLYELYPPSEPRLRLNKILGGKSCLKTWKMSQMNGLKDSEAISILTGPMEEIVIVKAERRKETDLVLRLRKIMRMRSLRSRIGLSERVLRGLVRSYFFRSKSFLIIGSIFIGFTAIGYNNYGKPFDYHQYFREKLIFERFLKLSKPLKSFYLENLREKFS